jgi:hypothetical protein
MRSLMGCGIPIIPDETQACRFASAVDLIVGWDIKDSMWRLVEQKLEKEEDTGDTRYILTVKASTRE